MNTKQPVLWNKNVTLKGIELKLDLTARETY